MSVRLVTAVYSTIVRLVRRVNVAVFLAIAAIGESPLAATELALEGFLAWNRRDNNRVNSIPIGRVAVSTSGKRWASLDKSVNDRR